MIVLLLTENDNFLINVSTGRLTVTDNFINLNPSIEEVSLIVKAMQTDNQDRIATAIVKVQIDRSPVLVNRQVETSPAASSTTTAPTTTTTLPSTAVHFTDCLIDDLQPLAEHSLVGTVLTQVNATNFDDTVHKYKLSMEIIDGTDATPRSADLPMPFSIDQNGIITVSDATALDRELTDDYRLVVTVSQDAVSLLETDLPEGSCDRVVILVKLVDINDNSPIFDKDEYLFTIEDTIEKNTVIGHVEATDVDLELNGKVEYTVEQDDGEVNGDVEFRGELMPNGSLGILLTYETVSRPAFLARYRLTVIAKDGGENPRSSRTKVVINVGFTNSNVPTFENDIYEVEVVEHTAVGVIVANVTAVDEDDGAAGEFEYKLLNGTDVLQINQDGEVTVKDSALLDRETTDTLTVEIAAIPTLPTLSNISTTFFTIKLIDINDHSPEFVDLDQQPIGTDGYIFDMPANIKIGELVAKVEAIDLDEGANAGVQYVAHDDAGGLFTMNDDGSIILAKEIDATTNATFEIVVGASDSPVIKEETKTDVAKVTIRMTAVAARMIKPPRFINLPNELTISESFPPGSLVYTLTAVDGDGTLNDSNLKFEIVSDNLNSTFIIEGNVLHVNTQLDAETIDEYTLTLRVTSKTTNSSSTSTLRLLIDDANDHTPQFEKDVYIFDLTNVTLEANTLIGKVRATDGDKTDNQVKYKMELAAAALFTVDSTTGELRVGPTSLTNLGDTFSFTVQADDSAVPPFKSTAFVTLKLKRTATPPPVVSGPAFSGQKYTIDIPENTPAKVFLTLNDEKRTDLTFKMVTDALSSIFAVDETSGSIATLVELDYEEKTSYNFDIRVCVIRTMTGCSTIPIHIRVMDTNDNTPQWTQNVYTAHISLDHPVGDVVTTVHADDEDSGALGQLGYSLRTLTGHFSVDVESGDVILTMPLTEATTFNLTVDTFDHGAPMRRNTTFVVITVNGNNAHAPVFDAFMYDIEIAEDMPIGTNLTDVTAVDGDAGDEGVVTYSFGDDEQTRKFAPYLSLDTVTGNVRLAQELDYETLTEFRVVVTATDSNPTMPRLATTVVHVMVVNVNDNPPEFDPLPSTIYISSAKRAGDMILTVSGSDTDDEAEFGDGPISIEMTSENEQAMEYFVLTDGELKVKQELVQVRFQVQIF